LSCGKYARKNSVPGILLGKTHRKREFIPSFSFILQEDQWKILFLLFLHRNLAIL